MSNEHPDVPPPPPGRRLRARDALVVVGIATLLLVVLEGRAVRDWADQMDPGIGRDVVSAFGEPAGWVADRLPLADASDDVTGWIAQEEDLGEGGFDVQEPAAKGAEGGIPPVTPESFDPVALGEEPPKLKLDKVLVTGDSLAQPLDVELARRLAEDGVEVERDVNIGTGISKEGLVDWGQLSTKQARDEKPDAVVVFIGANEGFPIPLAGGESAECCGADWAAAFAGRVRRMMDTYRRGAAARVYWLTIPTPRDGDLAEVARAVNAAVDVASVPYRAHVRVLDMGAVFTPDDRFRSSLDGEIVREPDGLHLTPAGAELAADVVLEAVERDFPD
jgi:lysophospholipase L1-like esterase